MLSSLLLHWLPVVETVGRWLEEEEEVQLTVTLWYSGRASSEIGLSNCVCVCVHVIEGTCCKCTQKTYVLNSVPLKIDLNYHRAHLHSFSHSSHLYTYNTHTKIQVHILDVCIIFLVLLTWTEMRQRLGCAQPAIFLRAGTTNR